MAENAQKDDMVMVDAAQVIAARGAIKAAKRLGKEPNPLMVKIASADHASCEDKRSKSMA